MFTHYAELQCTTNYSYLRGASHPEELVKQAAQLGLYALAITDENTLGGVVRAHSAAKDAGLKLLIGARITPVDGPDVLLYATNRAAYGRLARLITIGKSNAIQPPRTTAPSSADRIEKGTCRLSVDDIVAHSDDLIALVSPFSRTRSESTQPSPIPPALIDAFRGRLYIAATRPYGPDDAARLRDLRCLADAHRLPLAATNDVHYHAPARRQMQDALTCIRERCAISEAGYRLFANAERHLKPADEMCRLFRDMPAAIDATTEITDRCRFSLDELRYEYPVEIAPSGLTPMAHLTQLTWRGARERFPDGTPDKVRRQIEHELQLIEELSYEAYFLTVYDVVRFARSRGILCQGRGSAANSAVCYCIGVTSVDPARVDLLFERFISRERNEPPDIDVDFEHERREEVIQYIYARFGRDRAGLTAENITYRPRSAVRDVGKALGLSLDCVDRLARSCDWWDAEALPAGRLAELGLDPARHTTQLLVKLTRTLLTFPRHRSQHVGGFVITRGPLCELVPIENAAMPDRTVIEWDKDDIDALGILKVDVLGLGMLTAIGRAFRMVEGRGGMTKARRGGRREARRHGGTKARRGGRREARRHGGTRRGRRGGITVRDGWGGTERRAMCRCRLMWPRV
ncbi:MAG: PHP domain-containing protein [Phycisphaerae bacterium]|nr:PHP domain-containing protein [Phycisphaerae bacterium]